MHIDWAGMWSEVWKELVVVYHNLGLGGGALALQLLRFIPAPYENMTWRGMFMDALWTVAGQSRAGERRRRDGGLILTGKPQAKPAGIIIQESTEHAT
jgi:hypothetical protein